MAAESGQSLTRHNGLSQTENLGQQSLPGRQGTVLKQLHRKQEEAPDPNKKSFEN